MHTSSYFGRQLNILDYALSSLYRRKLKNIGIFCVFASVIFLFASFQLLTRGLTETARTILQDGPDITIQRMSAGRQVAIDTSLTNDLRSIYGISRIVPRVWGYYFDESNGANYTVIGLAAEDLTRHFSSAITGRLPAGQGEVVLSEDVRRSMGLFNRRSFSLFRPDLSMSSFTTTGTFMASSSLVTADMMLMSLKDARDLFDLEPPMVTDLLVHVGNELETDTIAGKIADILPGTRVITRNQIMKTYSVVFSWRSGFGAVCLLSSLVAFLILAYDKASGLSREDKQEVGILKILGWQATDVMLVRFWQSAVIAMLAFFFGYTLAWIHIIYWHGVLFNPILLGWSVLRPSLSLVPFFNPGDILLVFSVSVLPYLCATVVPAWKSAVIRPDTVI